MNKIWSFPYKRGVIIFLMIIPFLTGANCSFTDLFSKEIECEDDFFTCWNKECIPKSYRCDGTPHCQDASDELDCEKYLCQAPNWFPCETSRICIASKFRCDNEIDCRDGSDEKNCKNITNSAESLNCSGDHFQCNDKACIPMYQVCDNTYDCADLSDEIDGCTISLDCDGFRCKNKRCIPLDWRCNKVDDCIDNSDEENCEIINPHDCTIENELYLCKNGIDCIPLHEMCDNITQCPDHSDESTHCTDSHMRCSAHKCSHDCIQTPSGPLCLCPKGYYEAAPKLCKDINECETYGICDQKCRNTEGSYECYCDSKYILQADKKTCKADGGEGQLFMSTKHEIRGLSLDSQLYYLIANKLKHVVSVAFDGDHIYWTDVHEDNAAIVKAEKDGSNRELLITSGLGAPEDLAIDWITGNVYFTDAELQHVGVCTNDGLHCTIIDKYIRKPRGIALHIVERNMYWTDWGEMPEIARASMDGENDISFVSNNILWPNSLTIDVPNNRLYWIDAKKNTIESIKMDGTDRRIILGGNFRHPYSIAVFENRIFWTDWKEHALLSCDKFTGKNRTTLITHHLGDIYDIHIYHSALFPKVENLCANSKCSHICMLSSVTGYKCACPPSHELNDDKHTCREIHQCDINLFTCENGRCIDKNLTCNNEDDCLDNSDEKNCEVSNRDADISDIQALICNDDEFPCTSNTSICVPEDDKCNGISDCPQGEDELNCREINCQKDEFKCNNGKCIQESWVCDKTDDCGDKSDENFDACNFVNGPMDKNQDIASNKFNISAYKEIPCKDGCCKSGKCIEWKLHFTLKKNIFLFRIFMSTFP